MVSIQTYVLPDNVQILFTDSGPPPNSNDYTTVVIFHGSAFNGYGMEKMHEPAHELNLRTVIWNRRDYPGSTPYTDSELEDLKQGRRIFMDRIGRQVAGFLEQYIEKENIPTATSDNKAGGIALMGWSMGNPSAWAIFSDPKAVPPETYLKLELYVKNLILYEPPYLCFSYPLPSDVELYNPWKDPDQKTPEALYENFCHWVSSFYNHQDINSPELRDLDSKTKRSSDATVTKWSPEDLKRYLNVDAAVRSELPMYVEPMQTVLREVAEQVFYDEKLVKSYFPDLKATLIVGTKSNWECTWGSLKTQHIHNQRVAKGDVARPMQTYRTVGGNHYAHWEMPKTLLEKAREGMTRVD